MSGHCCDAAARHFDRTRAEGDLAGYRAKGLDKRGRQLLAALVRAGVSGRSVLDVGAGAGMMSFELLKAGSARARLADASAAFLDVARQEAERSGVLDRFETTLGDFVETSRQMDPADIVVMDRVVCCYPEWAPLLNAAMTHGRSLIGMTYPRARPDVRLVMGFDNLLRRFKRNVFRTFVHPPAAMQTALEAGGWRLVYRSGTFVWRVDVYERS
jgi:SAM-dependent methyltransferase